MGQGRGVGRIDGRVNKGYGRQKIVMSDVEESQIERLLNDADRAPGVRELRPGGADGARWAALVQAAQASRGPVGVDEDVATEVGLGHLGEMELRDLVVQRRVRPEAWQAPGHLVECELCLEAFEAMSERQPEPTAEALARFEGVYALVKANESSGIGGPLRWPTEWRVYAAAAALVLVVGVAMVFYLSRPLVRLSAGELALVNGASLGPGASVPIDTLLVAKELTRTKMQDGSTVLINKGARLAFTRPQGQTLIRLEQGGIDAAVTKRNVGESFTVATQLGEAIVVGTRFTVTTAGPKPDQDAPPVSATDTIEHTAVVTVNVTEGVVRVRRGEREARVAAGSSAILRDGVSDIELLSPGD